MLPSTGLLTYVMCVPICIQSLKSKHSQSSHNEDAELFSYPSDKRRRRRCYTGHIQHSMLRDCTTQRGGVLYKPGGEVYCTGMDSMTIVICFNEGFRYTTLLPVKQGFFTILGTTIAASTLASCHHKHPITHSLLPSGECGLTFD